MDENNKNSLNGGQQQNTNSAPGAYNNMQNNQQQNAQNQNLQSPYGNQGQPYSPYSYGQPQYNQQNPNPYTGQGNPPVINGQPQYNQYGQPLYSDGYNPYITPPKRKSKVGLIIGITAAAIFLLIIGFFTVCFIFNKEISVNAAVGVYNETQDFSDLIDVCNAYNDALVSLDADEALKAEEYYTLLMSDMSKFKYSYNHSDSANYYDNDNEALNILAADYFYLMLKNGNPGKYISEFTRMMMECSPSDTYYIDSYTFVGNISAEVYQLNDEQKLTVLQGFDNLVAQSTTEYERYLNLQEYYDCCEALGIYDKAEEIAARLKALAPQQ